MEKDRAAPSLFVAIYSPTLRGFFASAISNTNSPFLSCPDYYDSKTFFSNYMHLQAMLRSHQWDKLDEVRLFMQDFLLDIDIWSSFGLESLYKINIQSASHWQDMQKWSTERDTYELQEPIETNDEDDNEGDTTSNTIHADTNAQDLDKWLWEAAREGRTDEIRQHLSEQTRLISANTLTVALKRGHIDTFWLLFNFGAAAYRDTRSWMAGHVSAASKLSCIKAVESLVHQSNRLRVNQRKLAHFSRYREPFRAAIEGGHESVVSYFLDLDPSFVIIHLNAGRSPPRKLVFSR